jgi:hypothetical protein
MKSRSSQENNRYHPYRKSPIQTKSEEKVLNIFPEKNNSAQPLKKRKLSN